MYSTPPFFYDYTNSVNSLIHPSTTYVSNSQVAHIFKRYLLQKAMSVFEWKMPENWTSPFYVLYCLYTFGYIGIIPTKEYGVIPQQCALSGYGLYYQPTKIVVSNGLLRQYHEFNINKNAIVLQLQPDYGGITDLVELFGDLLALCLEASSINILNSRLAYFAAAESEGQAETFKKIIDDVVSGKPGVVYNNQNLIPKGQKLSDVFQLFNTNVSSNFIAPELLNVWKTLENMFDTEIGIPSANTEKRERMISAEINVGSVETYSRVDMWLKLLQQRVEDAKALFGITDLSVDWRYSPELTGMKGENGNESGRTTDNVNNVQS